MKRTILQERSFQYAVSIFKFSDKLQKAEKEFNLSRQLIRSGTAIGALIHEAKFAESKNDFSHKFSIALKEANETEYWLRLLEAVELGDAGELDHLQLEVNELIAILAASVKTMKSKG